MFRLDNILEYWAQHYRPLSHDPIRAHKHCTFFRVGMIDGNSEFVRNFNVTPSPAMAYVTHIDGELEEQNPKVTNYRHVIYFMVKQAAGTLSKTAATDEMSATDARFFADEMVQDLLAYLFNLKAMVNGKYFPKDVPGSIIPPQPFDKLTQEGLRGLQLEKANWATLPMMFSGWHVCGLTLYQVAPRDLCIKPNKYIDSSESSSD